MDELIARVTAVLTDAGLSAQEATSSGALRRVTEPRFSAALKSARCVSGAAYDYYGERETADGGSVSVFGKRMAAEILVTVLSPDAETSPEAVSDAVEALCGGIPGAALKELSVGEAFYRPREDAFACELTVKLTALLLAESDEDEPEFLTFRMEGEGK